MTNNIPEDAWDSIYSFLQGVCSLHTKDEEKTRCFVEGVWADLMSEVSDIDDQSLKCLGLCKIISQVPPSPALT